MITFSQRRWRNLLWLSAGIGCVFLFSYFTPALGDDDSTATGWTLFGIILVLLGWNLRKKVSYFNLLKGSTWLQWHVGLGILGILIFFAHVRYQIPLGGFDQTVTTLFALVSISGLVGLFLSRYVPPHLSRHGDTIIYEKIPVEMNRLKADAESVLLRSFDENKSYSESITKLYQNHVHPFLSYNRDYIQHLIGSPRPGSDLLKRINALGQQATSNEQKILNEIRRCIRDKVALDRQHALQSMLKYWLFFHIPVSLLLLLSVLAHIALVHAFRGYY